MVVKLLLFFSLILSSVAQDVLPSANKIDWSSTGVPGGIPNRTSIAATLAPNGGANSFWIDFDSDPINDDARAWEITPSSNVQTVDVSWGNVGTNPAKRWTLTAGPHKLYLRVREPGVQIKTLKFVLVKHL